MLANCVDPGWVATRMGGAGAPGGLDEGTLTQVWLATSDDPAATVTGRYFYHQQAREPLAATERAELQDELLDYCAGADRHTAAPMSVRVLCAGQLIGPANLTVRTLGAISPIPTMSGRRKD